MVFNKDEVFQGDLERLKDQLRKTSLEEIRKTLQKAMTEIPRDRFEEEEGARPAEEWVTSLPAGSNEEDLNPLAGEPLFLQEAARQGLELEERWRQEESAMQKESEPTGRLILLSSTPLTALIAACIKIS